MRYLSLSTIHCCEVIRLSERWLRRCENILKRIKALESAKDRDRLELVRSIRFALNSLWGSLSGWIQWINDPNVATRFNWEELEQMNKSIIDFVKSFIEYDIKITKQAIQKGIKERVESRERTVRRPPERLVI